MCMADYRIARFVRAVKSVVPSVNPGDVVVAANKDRVGLIVNPYTSTDGFSIDTEWDGTSQGGFTVSQGVANVCLPPTLFGDLPSRKFVTTVAPSSGLFNVVEFILPEHVLSAELRDY